MPVTLETSVQEIKGVGPRRAEMLAGANIHTVEGLLKYKPLRYEDRTDFRPIGEIEPDQVVVIEGTNLFLNLSFQAFSTTQRSQQNQKQTQALHVCQYSITSERAKRGRASPVENREKTEARESSGTVPRILPEFGDCPRTLERALSGRRFCRFVTRTHA